MPKIIVFILLVSAGLMSAFGQTEAGKTHFLRPRADSPTAVRRSGISLEEAKARYNTMRPYVFTGREYLRDMRYYVKETNTTVVDSKNVYRVPEGTRGWLSDDGYKTVIQECVNDASCEGCSPAVPSTTTEPAPPLPTPAPPSPSPPPEPIRLAPLGPAPVYEPLTRLETVPVAEAPVILLPEEEGRRIPCWNWPLGKWSLPACLAGAAGGYFAIASGGVAAVAAGFKPAVPVLGGGLL